jgi:hypothetical protein
MRAFDAAYIRAMATGMLGQGFRGQSAQEAKTLGQEVAGGVGSGVGSGPALEESGAGTEAAMVSRGWRGGMAVAG